MKLIISANEIKASSRLICGIITQMPGKTDWDLIDQFSDVKAFLKKVLTEPKHGFTVQNAAGDVFREAGETFDSIDVTELRLVIEITEDEYIAVTRLLSRHSGTIVSICKLYYTFCELCGNLAKTFVEDAIELTQSTVKFGQSVKVETGSTENAATPT